MFKIESHNHPSFIEPYQGAATGVGGIMRDIFTMGARPIASLNSLRFGDPDHEKTRYLLNGVVRGIADYGNCMGVPTVGGDIYFDACYNGNILVNAFCLGLAKADRIFLGSARESATRCCTSAPKPGVTAYTAPACPRRSSTTRRRRNVQRFRSATRLPKSYYWKLVSKS